MPIIKCKECKKEFKSRKRILTVLGGKKAFVKFCSRECSQKNKIGKRLKPRAKIIKYACPNCLNIFDIKESKFIAENRKCCSIRCAAEYKKKKFEINRGECIKCGNKLSSEQKKYCSNECIKKRSIMICEGCGKEFEYKSYQKNRKFCSNACYKKSNTETSIEKIIKEYLSCQGIFFKEQVAFNNYVVDFLLPEIGLVIEADGDYWHSKEITIKRDGIKDELLRMAGFSVVRLKEKDIKSGKFVESLSFLN